MQILTDNQLRALTHAIQRRVVTPYNDDLVAIIGLGCEENNAEAIANWLLGFAEAQEPDDRYNLLLNGATFLATQLTDLRADVALGNCAPLSECHPFLPSNDLSAKDQVLVARGIYYLLVQPAFESELKGLIELVLPGEGDAISRIVAWLAQINPTYTHLLREVTLPLACQLREAISSATNH